MADTRTLGQAIDEYLDAGFSPDEIAQEFKTSHGVDVDTLDPSTPLASLRPTQAPTPATPATPAPAQAPTPAAAPPIAAPAEGFPVQAAQQVVDIGKHLTRAGDVGLALRQGAESVSKPGAGPEGPGVLQRVLVAGLTNEPRRVAARIGLAKQVGLGAYGAVGAVSDAAVSGATKAVGWEVDPQGRATFDAHMREVAAGLTPTLRPLDQMALGPKQVPAPEVQELRKLHDKTTPQFQQLTYPAVRTLERLTMGDEPRPDFATALHDDVGALAGAMGEIIKFSVGLTPSGGEDKPLREAILAELQHGYQFGQEVGGGVVGGTAGLVAAFARDPLDTAQRYPAQVFLTALPLLGALSKAAAAGSITAQRLLAKHGAVLRQASEVYRNVADGWLEEAADAPDFAGFRKISANRHEAIRAARSAERGAGLSEAAADALGKVNQFVEDMGKKPGTDVSRPAYVQEPAPDLGSLTPEQAQAVERGPAVRHAVEARTPNPVAQAVGAVGRVAGSALQGGLLLGDFIGPTGALLGGGFGLGAEALRAGALGKAWAKLPFTRTTPEQANAKLQRVAFNRFARETPGQSEVSRAAVEGSEVVGRQVAGKGERLARTAEDGVELQSQTLEYADRLGAERQNAKAQAALDALQDDRADLVEGAVDRRLDAVDAVKRTEAELAKAEDFAAKAQQGDASRPAAIQGMTEALEALRKSEERAKAALDAVAAKARRSFREPVAEPSPAEHPSAGKVNTGRVQMLREELAAIEAQLREAEGGTLGAAGPGFEHDPVLLTERKQIKRMLKDELAKGERQALLPTEAPAQAKPKGPPTYADPADAIEARQKVETWLADVSKRRQTLELALEDARLRDRFGPARRGRMRLWIDKSKQQVDRAVDRLRGRDRDVEAAIAQYDQRQQQKTAAEQQAQRAQARLDRTPDVPTDYATQRRQPVPVVATEGAQILEPREAHARQLQTTEMAEPLLQQRQSLVDWLQEARRRRRSLQGEALADLDREIGEAAQRLKLVEENLHGDGSVPTEAQVVTAREVAPSAQVGLRDLQAQAAQVVQDRLRQRGIEPPQRTKNHTPRTGGRMPGEDLPPPEPWDLRDPKLDAPPAGDPVRWMLDEGMSPEVVAEELGVPVEDLHGWRVRKGRVVDGERIGAHQPGDPLSRELYLTDDATVRAVKDKARQWFAQRGVEVPDTPTPEPRPAEPAKSAGAGEGEPLAWMDDGPPDDTSATKAPEAKVVVLDQAKQNPEKLNAIVSRWAGELQYLPEREVEVRTNSPAFERTVQELSDDLQRQGFRLDPKGGVVTPAEVRLLATNALLPASFQLLRDHTIRAKVIGALQGLAERAGGKVDKTFRQSWDTKLKAMLSDPLHSQVGDVLVQVENKTGVHLTDLVAATTEVLRRQGDKGAKVLRIARAEAVAQVVNKLAVEARTQHLANAVQREVDRAWHPSAQHDKTYAAHVARRWLEGETPLEVLHVPSARLAQHIRSAITYESDLIGRIRGDLPWKEAERRLQGLVEYLENGYEKPNVKLETPMRQAYEQRARAVDLGHVEVSKGFNDTVGRQLETLDAMRAIGNRWLQVDRFLKQSFTTRNLAGHIGNGASNLVMDVLDNGLTLEQSVAANVDAGSSLLRWRQGKPVDPGVARDLAAGEKVGKFDTSLVEGELTTIDALGYDAGKSALPQAQVLERLRQLDAKASTTYKQGDAIPKVRQFLKGIGEIRQDAARLKPGEFLEYPVSDDGRFVRIERTDKGWLVGDTLADVQDQGFADAVAPAAMHHALRLLPDFADVPQYIETLRRVPVVSAVASPFVTWAWHAAGGPGKQGFVGKLLDSRGRIQARTNSAAVLGEQARSAARLAANRALLLSGLASQKPSEEDKLLQRSVAWQPRRLMLPVLAEATDPRNVLVSDWSAMGWARGWDTWLRLAVEVGTAHLDEGDLVQPPRVKPWMEGWEQLSGAARVEQFKAAERWAALSPREQQLQRNAARLFKAKKSGEHLQLSDVFDLLQLGGGLVARMHGAVMQSRDEDSRVLTSKLVSELMALAVGKTVANAVNIGWGAVDPGSVMTTRGDRLRRTQAGEGDVFATWAWQTFLGLGWRTAFVAGETESYLQRSADAFKTGMTGHLQERSKEAEGDLVRLMQRVDPQAKSRVRSFAKATADAAKTGRDLPRPSDYGLDDDLGSAALRLADLIQSEREIGRLEGLVDRLVAEDLKRFKATMQRYGVRPPSLGDDNDETIPAIERPETTVSR